MPSSASPPTRASSRRRSPGARLRRPDRRQQRRMTPRASSSASLSATSRPPAICSGRSGSEHEPATATSRSRWSPTLAADTEATIAQATRFHEAIAAAEPAGQDPRHRRRHSRDRGDDRPRLLDQRDPDLLAEPTPRDCRGLPARARATARRRRRPKPGPLGRQLLRLASRHRDRPPSRPKSDREDLKGRLGIANAKLAYQQYKELFSGERWETLAARGATKQRCLWASTSTKDPSLRDTLYVEELIGPETISTMPSETIRAFQDHGRVEADARVRPGRREVPVQPAVRGRRRLRRRRRHSRARGDRKVPRFLHSASGRDRPKASPRRRSGLTQCTV